jgi:hypothetical protein
MSPPEDTAMIQYFRDRQVWLLEPDRTPAKLAPYSGPAQPIVTGYIEHNKKMLKHGFDMYDVFTSAPGDLEREREVCRMAISDINAADGMPSKILLVSIGLTNDEQIVGFRAAVADNIRHSAYFIQVFEDDWGPKNLFRKMFYLAIECRDDPAFPMQEVVVFLKAAPRETDPEILAFRQELADRKDLRVFTFNKPEDLQPQVAAIARDWVRSILAAGGGVSDGISGAQAQGA